MCGTCHLPEYMQEDVDNEETVLGTEDDWADLYNLSIDMDIDIEWIDTEDETEEKDY